MTASDSSPSLKEPADAVLQLSAKLAMFADQAEEKLRMAGVKPDERCASCAFRAGTYPNTRAPATAMDALKCLVEHHPFGCHHDKKGGLPTRLCAGFVNILAADDRTEAQGGAMAIFRRGGSGHFLRRGYAHEFR